MLKRSLSLVGISLCSAGILLIATPWGKLPVWSGESVATLSKPSEHLRGGVAFAPERLQARVEKGSSEPWPSEVARLEMRTPVAFSVLKIFPGHGIYGLSYRQSQLVTFGLNGAIRETVDLAADRPSGVRFHFFDFYVDSDGEIYVLAVWRERPRETSCGVFRYDNEGTFKGLSTLTRHVDGRKILVDDKKNLIILGLSPDMYFGRTKQLRIFHKYNVEGEYLDSFFQLDWRDYLSPGQTRIADVYHNLRYLADRLPVGIDPRFGVFGVVPGTHTIVAYDPDTYEITQKVHLATPPFQHEEIPVDVSAKLGDREGVIFRIANLQITDDSFVVEFDQIQRFVQPRGRVQSKLLATYDRQRARLQTVKRIDPEHGVLLTQVGERTDHLYTVSTQGLETRILLPRF